MTYPGRKYAYVDRNSTRPAEADVCIAEVLPNKSEPAFVLLFQCSWTDKLKYETTLNSLLRRRNDPVDKELEQEEIDEIVAALQLACQRLV